MSETMFRADVETAVRIMNGQPYKATDIDNEGLKRFTCCGLPPGRHPNHDFVLCLADMLTRGDTPYEIQKGAELGRWAEEQAYN